LSPADAGRMMGERGRAPAVSTFAVATSAGGTVKATEHGVQSPDGPAGAEARWG
jgi:hypothetical protein